MATDQQRDTANFFRVSNYNEAYWDAYLAARPKYTPSFYSLIYAYHDAHSASRAVAHDIGTGPGQVASPGWNRTMRVGQLTLRIFASRNPRGCGLSSILPPNPWRLALPP